MTTLYHYCSGETFTSIIKNQSLWLSSMQESNDYLEGKLINGIINNSTENNTDHTKQGNRTLLSNIIPMANDCHGICFSTERDKLSQWRGYADDGRGFSIGFNKDWLLELAKKENALLQAVSYYDDYELQASSQLEYALKILDQAGRNAMTNIRPYLEFIYTSKHKSFAEENEWRLIKFVNKTMIKNARFANGKLIPYTEINLQNLNESPINEIIVGPKNLSDYFVTAAFLRNNGLGNIDINKSISSYR
ncbi:hypothetical protein BUE93_05845 [Chromobacterium amazonense]|uniref:DUF2971 domain-containing protein n=1 Tax=Chromobacterium amazonense TaxID=1382803 RepID=A0A2S9X733_9NEIS|nr:DUF2971 domain-containing protein [Chromobacterium amazonense]PRP71520.1 hypothetical protein BUE93_05845 [Chromobacterium amazonense]